jgi:hypothetical protein
MVRPVGAAQRAKHPALRLHPPGVPHCGELRHAQPVPLRVGLEPVMRVGPHAPGLHQPVRPRRLGKEAGGAPALHAHLIDILRNRPARPHRAGRHRQARIGAPAQRHKRGFLVRRAARHLRIDRGKQQVRRRVQPGALLPWASVST